MIVKQFKNGNFNLQKEINYDSDEEGLAELVVRICNSAEMDFTIQKDALIGLSYYWLFNFNTNKFYSVDKNDAMNFDNGKVIKLEGIVVSEDDPLKELFPDVFDVAA